MKIGFIESIKRIGKEFGLKQENNFRIIAPRTTVYKNEDVSFQDLRKRTSIVESFRQYTTKILPQMEQQIEIYLLQKQQDNNLLKEYTRRRIQQLSIELNKIKRMPIKDMTTDFHESPEGDLYCPVFIGNHDENDIGQYCLFSHQDIQKYFRNGQMFGDYYKNEFFFTNKFGIMITEEGAKIGNHLSYIQNNLQNNYLDYEQVFYKITSKNVKQRVLEDEDIYPYLFHDLEYFDINIPGVVEHRIELEKFQSSPRYLPKALKKYSLDQFVGFNSGCLLYGEHGSGKSGVLLYVTMWAHYHNWVVVNIPSAYEWTQKVHNYERHPLTGIYIQNELANDWLKSFKQANEQQLKSIPVDMKYYGKYNLSGQHDNEPPAVKNIEYKDRKVKFEDHKQFYGEKEQLHDIEMNKKFNVRISEKLTQPQNLLEIVDYGIDNLLFSNNAIYEVLEQLRFQNKCGVLKVIDGYNFMYRRSAYPSFRYSSDTKLQGTVPPYHLSVPRAFINFDGHKLKNGFVLCASSIKQYHQHQFTPDSILFPKGYSHQMKGIPLDDFRHMCLYYIQNGFWQADITAENTIDFLWMHCQGNWAEAQRIMKQHHLDLI